MQVFIIKNILVFVLRYQWSCRYRNVTFLFKHYLTNLLHNLNTIAWFGFCLSQTEIFLNDMETLERGNNIFSKPLSHPPPRDKVLTMFHLTGLVTGFKKKHTLQNSPYGCTLAYCHLKVYSNHLHGEKLGCLMQSKLGSTSTDQGYSKMQHT